MTSAVSSLSRSPGRHRVAAALLAGVAFSLLFAEPLQGLVREWWRDPEAGHGLLLAPLAGVLAWRRGLVRGTRPATCIGLALLVAAILLRYFSGLAAELFTMRLSMLIALAALVVFHRGWRQLVAWWLPFSLLLLAIPLPELVLGSVTLPLQYQASRTGAWLLEARHVPVLVSGNVIRVPGQDLFVTEACSGLRSLMALLSLGVLLAGTMLGHPVLRGALVMLTIPLAVLVNGLRVFLTGFLVFHVGPQAGVGFLHFTEGWLLFVFAFMALATLAWGGVRLERRWRRPKSHA